MDKSQVNTQEEESNEQEGKSIAYYAALMHANHEYNITIDKTLLTLSAGSIGILLTILTAVTVRSHFELWLYGASIASFGVTIIGVLSNYRLSAIIAKDILVGVKPKTKTMESLGKLYFGSFASGVLFTLGIGMVSAYHKLASLQVN